MERRYLAVLCAGLALAPAACGKESDGKPEATTPSSTASQQSTAELEPITDAGANRVDLADRLVKKIELPGGPDRMVSGFGSLWVKQDSGGVVRLDPGGDVIGEVAPDDAKTSLCQGIGATDDAIWTCPREGMLTKIDPKTDSVAASVRIDKLPDQGRIVSTADQLWVLTKSGKELTGIDLGSDKPSQAIDLGSICTDLATDGEAVWVTCLGDGLLLRVAAETGQIEGEVALSGARQAAVDEHVWVGFDDGVAQVDPNSLEVVAVYELYPGFAGSIYAGGGEVWVREGGDRFLSRIDPEGQRIVDTIRAPELPSGGDVLVFAGSVWATAYDDATLVQLQQPRP